MKKPEALGLIPARGGSKGVPGKNKRLLAGKPLIQWTIEAAHEAESITQILVSTDDHEIAEISRACGAEVIMRPPELAQDQSLVIDAIQHVMMVLRSHGEILPECIALLQPTAPTRLPSDIDNAVAIFSQYGKHPVCSVVKVEDAHPARMYTLTEDGTMASLFPRMAAARRQDLPPIYHRNGAVYVFGQREVNSGEIVTPNMLPYIMPAERSFNIDTEIDWKIIQMVMGHA
jgi:CMP-N,N'-diacetyllegionaminic acid synthase